MIADTFNRDATQPDPELHAATIHLPEGGKPAMCYLVNENNPHVLSAVKKIIEAAPRGVGAIIWLTTEEMDALKDPAEFRAFPPPTI